MYINLYINFTYFYINWLVGFKYYYINLDYYISTHIYYINSLI